MWEKRAILDRPSYGGGVDSVVFAPMKIGCEDSARPKPMHIEAGSVQSTFHDVLVGLILT